MLLRLFCLTFPSKLGKHGLDETKKRQEARTSYWESSYPWPRGACWVCFCISLGLILFDFSLNDMTKNGTCMIGTAEADLGQSVSSLVNQTQNSKESWQLENRFEKKSLNWRITSAQYYMKQYKLQKYRLGRKWASQKLLRKGLGLQWIASELQY